jgi:hypothetical protein
VYQGLPSLPTSVLPCNLQRSLFISRVFFLGFRSQLQLRKYEDDFQQLHGRKVKYQKDIYPVADDYQRYKVRMWWSAIPALLHPPL